jgi:uncharacterized protein (TIGR04255 family)
MLVREVVHGIIREDDFQADEGWPSVQLGVSGSVGMTITEVFPNPTVKQVVFQIKFPSLFYLEGKMGDLQLKLMSEFPESAILYRRRVVVADLGPGATLENIPADQDDNLTKIWQFKSENKCILNVMADSLDISSEYHKTYNLSDGPRFRDVIELVVASFLEVTRLPLIRRVGLRYIDDCPIISKDNKTLRKWYNSAFPLDRFPISLADEMHFRTVVQRNDFRLRYMETLSQEDGKQSLLIDFDGFATNVEAGKYLEVTDQLHQMISEEYEQSIKQPLIDHMRQQPSR